MIIIYPFVADWELLARAALSLGLELVQAEHFRCGGRFQASQHCPPGFNPAWRPDRVLQVRPEYARYCSRPPHEVGLWRLEVQTVLIWDDFKEGFGLVGHLGTGGERLRQAYTLEVLRSWCQQQNQELETELRADQTLVCWLPTSTEPVLLIQTSGQVATDQPELVRDVLQQLGIRIEEIMPAGSLPT